MIKVFEDYNLINSENYITNISEEQFKSLLKDTLFDPNKKQIYRHVREFYDKTRHMNFKNNYDDFNIVNPSIITRTSPYALSNLYNLMLSNLPSWKEYPKRNKSLICGDYNRVVGVYLYECFIVIPLNNDAKIGVCNDDDIWQSFYTSLRYDLSDFMEVIKPAIWIKDDENWENILKNFDTVDKVIKQNREYNTNNMNLPFEKIKRYINTSISEINKLYDDWVSGTITTLDFFSNLLEPERNKFKLEYYKDFNIKEDKEVWIDSPSLLVKPSVLEKMIDKKLN